MDPGTKSASFNQRMITALHWNAESIVFFPWLFILESDSGRGSRYATCTFLVVITVFPVFYIFIKGCINSPDISVPSFLCPQRELAPEKFIHERHFLDQRVSLKRKKRDTYLERLRGKARHPCLTLTISVPRQLLYHHSNCIYVL